MTHSEHHRHYVMCRPTYFTVSYSINPWMDTKRAVDTGRAIAQWESLRDTYRDLGHTVETIEPVPGLPDMVFAANGATMVDGIVLSSRFRHPQRQPEAAAYLRWFADHGFATQEAISVNEGEGDFLLAGDCVLAGFGQRTDVEAHSEAAALWGKPIIPLRLIDPRFYHLDTALTVLGGGGGSQPAQIAYLPAAFDDMSAELLRDRFPDALLVDEREACELALNTVSDGVHAVMTPRAPRFAAMLRERGFEIVTADTSELLLSGGGAKCCTLTVRQAVSPDESDAPLPRPADLSVPVQSAAPTTSTGSGLVHNYTPLPVTIASGLGSWVTDVAGRRYLDMLAGYSALNFGHRHPALVEAATRQLGRVTLTSRAFNHDLLEPFADAVAGLIGPLTTGGSTGTAVLPMNTGAEAVESAIKIARKWGYDVRGIQPGAATVIVASGNFHGRTTTIVSFSDDATARDGFGPYTPGFRLVDFADADQVAEAIDETTVAVLVEPIQGEAGVIVPPPGYWPALRALCDERDVLLIADEIQSGLGRTGTTLATELWHTRADLVTLGKALGGGIVPVSAVVGRADVLGVLTPGTHGSTFGGNPLACAVGLAVVELLADGGPQDAARLLGARLHERLSGLVDGGLLTAVRSVGAWAGIDVAMGTGRELCLALAHRGVLAKDTHGSTIRLAPALTTSLADLDEGLDTLTDVLRVWASR